MATVLAGVVGMRMCPAIAEATTGAGRSAAISQTESITPVGRTSRTAQIAQTAPSPDRLRAVEEQAQALSRLRTLIVTKDGEVLMARGYRGGELDRPVNIKSASKVIISALVGRAIAEGVLPGTQASIAPLLKKRLPRDANPRLAEVTIEDLLTMRAGLERTSGPNYGRWVASRDWVGFAVSRPFVDEPGARMLYSTGSTHLLSAILTDASGRSTRELADAWLMRPLGVAIGAWDRDPQGVYLGGNNMALSPRALMKFGEMMRTGGAVGGRQIVPREWIQASWTARTQSQFTGDGYGYGWFTTQADGHAIHYAWGYGGQMLYIVPDLALTVVMTSAADQPSGNDGYLQQLHGLLTRAIMPAVTPP